MPVKEIPMLILRDGQGGTREWPLDKPMVGIGRTTESEILLEAREVSRQHAQIERRGSVYVLSDLGSKNKTYVNGRPIHEPYVLKDGDEISIAMRFKLLFVDAESTVPLPPSPLAMRGLHIDEATKRVAVNGIELTPALSAPQYSLLAHLYAKANTVCPRDEVVRAVWSDAAAGVSEQAVDALVRRLRDRLKELDPHEYIVTVRGHGLMLDNPPSDSPLDSL
jgi:DNA-binding response OmpR family regulator